ncbi:MAG: hypothetical protein E7426_01370 [Ruminococcaceae bacterium]|nr:hypothetical protein [Oscillospiraceae bacterium]
MKSAGVLLVLLGGVGVWGRFSRTLRRDLALIRDLSTALALLESSVRWKRLPLPQAIKELAGRDISGKYFSEIEISLKSNIPLQVAWCRTFCRLPHELADILCAMEWSGDAQQLQGSMHYAAQQLAGLYGRRREALGQQEKLCAAATFSAVGLLIVVLI